MKGQGEPGVGIDFSSDNRAWRLQGLLSRQPGDSLQPHPPIWPGSRKSVKHMAGLGSIFKKGRKMEPKSTLEPFNSTPCTLSGIGAEEKVIVQAKCMQSWPVPRMELGRRHE